MTAEPDYPPLPHPDDDWSLRFTQRALADLGVDRHTDPASITAIRDDSSCPEIVDKFADHYTETREPTSAGLVSNVGGNTHKLKSGSRPRGCVWIDNELHVVWFVAFTDEHDYSLFEDRYRQDQLLPSDRDVELALRSQEHVTFEDLMEGPLHRLLEAAVSQEGTPQRATINELLKVELVVSPGAEGGYVEVFISARVPPEPRSKELSDWPGGMFLPGLFELLDLPTSRMRWPQEVPCAPSRTRPVDHAQEQVASVSMLRTRLKR